MIEFSKQIADRWAIPQSLSELICIAYEKGDTPYYLAEYNPEVAIELTTSTVWEIYDFLDAMEELGSKKKRVLNALKKADKVTPNLERRINLTSSEFELDDLLIPLRPNPRSKGQLAIKKGLESLVDLILLQGEESASIEDLVGPYIGKDPSLSSMEDVTQGVKDLLAERFAYDETVRAMSREFAYDDGFFEVTPKNKKDEKFGRYAGKQVSINEITKEEILAMLAAEEQKTIRLKLGVQLFRITELLRHHFVTNPDSISFDILCETIDESWMRLLQPIVERDVKLRLKTDAEEWASKQIVTDLEKSFAEELRRGAVFFVDAAHKNLLILAISGQGDLLGATSDKKPADPKSFSGDRLRQFLTRHRPTKILVCENDQAEAAEIMLRQTIDAAQIAIEIERFHIDTAQKNPASSEWMLKEFSRLLDDEMRELYGSALLYLRPISLLQKIGTESFSVHPFQQLLSTDRFIRIIDRICTEAALKRGVVLKDIVDSPIKEMKPVTDKMLAAIRAADAKDPLVSKNDLLKIPGMNEIAFRNLAGFIVVPNSDNDLDRSLVHPDHYAWVAELGEQLTVSTETIIGDPEMLRSCSVDDPLRKIFLEKRLVSQLQAAQRFASQASPRAKRKMKLTEVKEGSIVSGRVTNITQFGVFVNINAVCDGLIHISQLADEYVETPEQVVSVGDKVDVRILKVDVKKRRVSLSMKNLGNRAPHVKPSQGQLSTLADHFKNR